MSAFGIVLARDLLLAWRRPVNCWLPAVFFVVAVSLFPLGVGAEPQTLRQIAGGIVWVCALLSALLGLSFLFDADFEDGSLEQMVLSGHSLAEISAAKCTVHWLLTGVPLIIAGPVAGLLLGLDTFPLWVMTVALLLGTPVLSVIGAAGSALTVGIHSSVALLTLLVLPLCIPVLVFGAGAVVAADAGMSVQGHLSILAALLILTGLAGPHAVAAGLRISLG